MNYGNEIIALQLSLSELTHKFDTLSDKLDALFEQLDDRLGSAEELLNTLSARTPTGDQ